MDTRNKASWQQYQLPGVVLLAEVARGQVDKGWGFCVEQPQGSHLLKLDCISVLLELEGVVVRCTSMCTRGLKDPATQEAYQKDAILRGNVPLAKAVTHRCRAH
eukprot:15456028-Alexandrium_andersonii.AAC.1